MLIHKLIRAFNYLFNALTNAVARHTEGYLNVFFKFVCSVHFCKELGYIIIIVFLADYGKFVTADTVNPAVLENIAYSVACIFY